LPIFLKSSVLANHVGDAVIANIVFVVF